MDDAAIEALVTALCELGGARVQETDSPGGSWLLAVDDDHIVIENVHRGAAIRLTGELGLESARADEVLSNTALCRGMLRFNGDRQADHLWLGLRPGDEPTFVLTRDLLTDGLTDTALAEHLRAFVELYRAWFEAAESVLGNGVVVNPRPPDPPAAQLLKV